MKRKRSTPAERKRLLEELARSGESVAGFCRSRGLGYATMMNWLAAAKSRALNFVEVDCGGGAANAGGRAALLLAAELALPGGVVLRIFQGRQGGAGSC